MWVTGTQSEYGLQAIKIIGLDTFRSLGSVALKEKFGHVETAPSIQYSFTGTSLPIECHDPDSIDLISKFIRAEAFPGPCNVFTLPLPCPVRWPALLGLFCEYGLVLKMISGDFQLTHLGLAKIRWTRELDSWKVMFQRRSIPILDMSAWELVDRLEEHGWQMSVLVPRRPPKEIDLTQALALPDKKFYINGRNLSLGHSYLAVLNLTKDLVKRGTPFFNFNWCSAWIK